MIEATLRQAVERLEKLRKASTPGPLHAQNAGDVFTDLGAPNAQGVNAEHNDAWHVASFMSGQNDMPYREEEANRELFLVLHRTIDAQIEVLNAGIVYFHEFHMAQSGGDYHYDDGRPMSPDRMYKITPEGRATLALAEAILGES